MTILFAHNDADAPIAAGGSLLTPWKGRSEVDSDWHPAIVEGLRAVKFGAPRDHHGRRAGDRLGRAGSQAPAFLGSVSIHVPGNAQRPS